MIIAVLGRTLCLNDTSSGIGVNKKEKQWISLLWSSRLIKNCEYTESTDSMVRNHLVFGIRNTKVQGKLMCTDV